MIFTYESKTDGFHKSEFVEFTSDMHEHTQIVVQEGANKDYWHVYYISSQKTLTMASHPDKDAAIELGKKWAHDILYLNSGLYNRAVYLSDMWFAGELS